MSPGKKVPSTTTQAATTTASPAAATTQTPAAAPSPAATTTKPPANTTTQAAAATSAPATTTTKPPAAASTQGAAATTTHAANTTQAPGTTTTKAPAATTTKAPGTTTSHPAASTTAAPGNSTTAGAGGGTGPGGGSGAGSGDATGDAPTVDASITVDPDDGTQQNPNSYQVAKSAKLKLTWNSTNADTVDIGPVGTGLAASGSQDIPTQDANYALVANGKTGKSQPFNIEVHTHDDGAVVGPHVDLGTGQVAVVSFVATMGNAPITSAKIGQTITLTATFSDATKSAKINGQDAALTAQPNGQQVATLAVTIDASCDGNFDAQAIGDGTGADTPQHIDIVPADATGAGTADATGAGTHDGTGAGTSTTTHPSSTTTHPPSTTTHAPSTSTTHAPSTSTTHVSSTTTHAPSTSTTHPASTTTHAIDDTAITGLTWGSSNYTHGEPVAMNAAVQSYVPDGKLVYFTVQSQENGGSWTKIAVFTQASGSWQSQMEVSAPVTSGQASATVILPHHDDVDGTGAGSGGASGGGTGLGSGADEDTCSFQFTASFTSGGGSGSGGGGTGH